MSGEMEYPKCSLYLAYVREKLNKAKCYVVKKVLFYHT